MPFFSTLKFLNYEISIFFVCCFELPSPPAPYSVLLLQREHIFLQVIIEMPHVSKGKKSML